MATRKPGDSSSNPENPKVEGSGLPKYLSSALRIPTTRPVGANTTDAEMLSMSGITKQVTLPIANVMVLDYVPTLGKSGQDSSAVNRAAYSEFNAIRSQISGNRNYEPADHMIYREAVNSMRDLFTYVRRIYRIINTYSATNLYKPKYILDAMGLDSQDWIDNAPALFQWLATHRGSLLPFPTVKLGNITDRRTAYNEFMFRDGDVDTAQTYVMNQIAFWSYEVVDQVKGLTPRKFPAKYAEFTQMWDEMYSGLQNSSDVYVIAADIRRAFGDNVVTDLPDTTSGDTIEYVKNDSILESLMNANIATVRSDVTEEFLLQFRITDTDGYIRCVPHITSSTADRYVNAKLSHINCVSLDSVSESTILSSVRFKPLISKPTITSSGAVSYYYEAMGTEVIVSARIAQKNYTDAVIIHEFCTYNGYSGTEEATALAALANFLGNLANFDWHPPVVIATAYDYATPDTALEVAIVEDIQNYIPISDEQLALIHEANLLAEFGFKD